MLVESTLIDRAEPKRQKKWDIHIKELLIIKAFYIIF
jgi:hypothetical protein